MGREKPKTVMVRLYTVHEGPGLVCESQVDRRIARSARIDGLVPSVKALIGG